MQSTKAVSIVTPKSLDDFQIPRSTLAFLSTFQDDNAVAGKIVVAAYNGYGLLALGPQKIFHVHILDSATSELSLSDENFPDRIVTTTTPSIAEPIRGAFIKGAYFRVTDFDNPRIVIDNRSQTFGDFEGVLLGKDIREVGNYLLMKAVQQAALLSKS